MPSGGYREGSGRPRGSLNKSTLEQSHRLSELAKTYTEDALMALVDVAKTAVQTVREWLRPTLFWIADTGNPLQSKPRSQSLLPRP